MSFAVGLFIGRLRPFRDGTTRSRVYPAKARVECYALLEEIAPSAIHTLNRALAVAEWKGATEGLAVLKDFDPPPG